MKFTLSWLHDFLETNATLGQITRSLTAIGLEVESVTDRSQALAPFIVARIKSAAPHPDADKLRVCQVDDGSQVRQVVCGAPNARAGINVALALEGVRIPSNGMVIKRSTIRGVESGGMLCSASELGIGEEGGGILELPDTAILGQPIAPVLGLDDPVIDVNLTPNRPDCLGVYGIARDLAASGLGVLKPLPELATPGTEPSKITVTLATGACPLFAGCTVHGVRNGPSPDWLARRLTAIGLRPISALVDITNYSTYSFARPLHVFDANKLTGGLTVRPAVEGESFAALNDKSYTLSADMVVLADEAGVQGLAGILGGSATACEPGTTDIFLESAWFDPVAVARAGRALGIESDARHRFERGVDPAFVETGARIALSLIVDLCGGTPGALTVSGKRPPARPPIAFRHERVESLGGLTLPPERIAAVLEALGFTVTGDQVAPPSWRADIEGESDLVEEVLRITGYDAIPSVPLPPAALTAPTPVEARLTLLRKTLALRGLNEICSWAFLPRAQALQFGGGEEALTLLNPIHADLDTMRPGLIPNLLTAAAKNAARGAGDLGLFETGPVFHDVTPAGQTVNMAAIRAGRIEQRSHYKTEREADLFDAKADLFALLAASGLAPNKLSLTREAPAWYHPSRSARISMGKITVGYFGELHPAVLKNFDIEARVAGWELLLGNLPLPKVRGKARAPLVLSPFQAVERDFAFTAPEDFASADLLRAIENADKTLIRSVRLFDVYRGAHLATGTQSLAVTVTLQSMEKTLEESDIEGTASRILAATAKLGLSLRQ